MSCDYQSLSEGIDIRWLGARNSSHADYYDFAGARIALERTSPRAWSRSQPSRRFQPIVLLQLSGHAVLSQFGKETDLQENSLVFLDNSQPHSFDVISDAELLYLVMPTGSFIPRNFARAASSSMDQPSRHNPIFASFLRHLWSALPALSPQQHGAALSAALSVAALAAPFYPEHDDNDVDIRVTRALNYIEHHLGDEGLTANRVAEQQSLSRRHLDLLFTKSVDYSLEGWIWERRLRRAEQQLSMPNFRQQSLLQIALELGFKSPSHFSRSFSQKYGMSPKRYRQERCAEPH